MLFNKHFYRFINFIIKNIHDKNNERNTITSSGKFSVVE